MTVMMEWLDAHMFGLDWREEGLYLPVRLLVPEMHADTSGEVMVMS